VKPALLAAAVVLAGCSTTISSSTPNQDARADAADFVPPGEVTIRVRNDGTRMLYVQASGWSGQEVMSIVKPGGGAVRNDTCELCNCSTCPSCSVCGRAAAHVAEIMPGTWLDFPWDQTDWTVIENGCGSTLECEQPTLVAPGALTAQARYSDTFSPPDMTQETYIGTAVTAQTEFMHPATDIVVVSIQ
jgi:hypothetical protein